MEFVTQRKQETILERFFIPVSRKDAVLIFQNVDETGTKERIVIPPCFPYMAKIEYHNLDKQL